MITELRGSFLIVPEVTSYPPHSHHCNQPCLVSIFICNQDNKCCPRGYIVVSVYKHILLPLSHFSRVWPFATPPLGFSRQEHWSGLPFPSPTHKSEKWKWSRSVMSDSSWPHGLQPTRLLHPWDFPGKSTGVGCHCLLR